MFQALRDALTERGEKILSVIRQVLDGAHVEDVENLAAALKAELRRRLESACDIASALETAARPLEVWAGIPG
jgi:hypothetical protein